MSVDTPSLSLFRFPHVLDLSGQSALRLLFLRSPSQETPSGLTALKVTPALTTPKCARPLPEAPLELEALIANCLDVFTWTHRRSRIKLLIFHPTSSLPSYPVLRATPRPVP